MMRQISNNEFIQIGFQLDHLELVRGQLDSSATLAEASRHKVTTLSLPELNTMEGSMFSAIESIRRILKLEKNKRV